MSEASPPFRRSLAAGGLALLAQASVWLDPVLGTVEPEEGLTAAQALIGQWTGVLDAQTLQYKGFCGGCTVDAALGSPLFALLGQDVWVWKLVPAIFAAVAAAAVHRAVARSLGASAAAWVLAAMVCVPPVVFEAGARGYGNHFEGGWLATVGIVLAGTVERRRAALALGVAASACVAITFSTAWLLAAAPAAALLRRRPDLALGIAMPITLFLGAWLTLGSGQAVLSDFLVYAATLPTAIGGAHPGSSQERIHAWATAWSPFVAEGRGVGGGYALGAALAGSVGAVFMRTGPARAVALGALVLALAHLVAPLQLPARPDSPFTARYAIPAAQLAAVGVGLAAHSAWSHRHRTLAVLLACAWARPAVVERAALVPRSEVAHLTQGEITPWLQVRRTLLVRRGASEVPWRCRGDPACRFHDGWRQGRAHASSRCVATEPSCPACDEEFTLGWQHGVAHALGSCQRHLPICERWWAVLPTLPSMDESILLDAAIGVGDSGSGAEACTSPAALSGVLRGADPRAVGGPVPTDLPSPAALRAWSHLQAHQSRSRMGGARVSVDHDPALGSVDLPPPSTTPWRTPSLDLGLATPR